MARFFVGERENVVPNASTRDIDISKFAGSDGCVVSFDAQSSSLKPTRKVREGACINQLTENGCARLCKSADEMNEAEAVEAEPRDVPVVDEVIALVFELVFWPPVAADGEDFLTGFFTGDDVGERDARWFVVLIFVLLAG